MLPEPRGRQGPAEGVGVGFPLGPGLKCRSLWARASWGEDPWSRGVLGPPEVSEHVLKVSVTAVTSSTGSVV